MSRQRTANLLGAVALAISDRLAGAIADLVDCGASGPAALITLVSAPGMGVTALGARIGLSQPAAARLVAALEARGLVERRPGRDGRSQALFPTGRGRRTAREALKLRGRIVGELVAALEPAEQDALARALETMLARLTDADRRPDVLCRICDRATCIAGGQACPVSQAARAHGV